MTGIVNINKPLGKTSHFVVAVARRITKIKKIGHTGTLDPLATGVLPICIGRESTKLSQVIMDGDKCYQAVIGLGMTTTTQDAEGEILEQREVCATEEQIRQAVEKFIGELSQVPPMYSAIKIDGKKLYQLARKGIEVERQPRKVIIYDISILRIDLEQKEVEILVHCSKGTYIRTLCQDIGEEIGCGGYMKSLIRTRCGSFRLEDSITLEEFETLWNQGRFEEFLIPPEHFLGLK